MFSKMPLSSALYAVSWREVEECSGDVPSLRTFLRPQDGRVCELQIQLHAEVWPNYPAAALLLAPAIVCRHCRLLKARSLAVSCLPRGRLPLQGIGGLQLVSSARIAEVYVLQAGGDRSYMCSLRGSPASLSQHQPHDPQQDGLDPQQRRPQLWTIAHRWQRPHRGGALVLRLLSLAERGTLHLASLEELPLPSSSADLTAPEGTAQAPGNPAAAGEVAGAGAGDAAGGGSQMDEIRGLLSQVAAQDSSAGSSGASSAAGAAAADLKRALMAAIARSVLQQPSASRGGQPARATGLAAAKLSQRPAGGQLQQGVHQQQQIEGKEEGQHWQHAQQQEVAAALQRLEGRVEALEGLCREMHSMLRQVVAAQQAQQTAPA